MLLEDIQMEYHIMLGCSLKIYPGSITILKTLKTRLYKGITLMNIKNAERILRLKDAQRYVKKTYHLDKSAVNIRGWINAGLVSHSGRRVVLRARKKFGQWFTTDRAIDEFVLELDQ